MCYIIYISGLGSAVVRSLASGSKGPRFYSPFSPSTFRYIFLGPLRSTQLVHLYRAGLVSINVGSFPARIFGFNCVITYVHHALAYQCSHPCAVGKLVPAISRGNNAMAVMGV